MHFTKQAFGSVLRTSSQMCFQEFDQVMGRILDLQVKIVDVFSKPAPKLHAMCSDLNYPNWIYLDAPDNYALETKDSVFQEILQ